MTEWIKENFLFVQYTILTFVGALIAHFKHYEKINIIKPLTWHVYSFIVKLTYAFLVTYLIYLISTYYAWPIQISLFLVGVCCVFANDVIDLIWKVVQNRLNREV